MCSSIFSGRIAAQPRCVSVTCVPERVGWNSTSTSVADSVKSVSGSVESVSERVAARSKQVTEGYKKLAETGRSQVRASPAISVLIAAAAGYGISKLLNSRK